MSGVVEAVTLDGGVVVGHDGSAAASEAVQWAADLAARLDQPLHVLRAWGMTNAPTPKAKQGGYIPPLADYEAAVMDELTSDIDKLALTCELRLHVVHGRAARELLVAAEGADIVVVGRRGAGGFHGLGFGSTADQVVRHAPCPVVTIPVSSADR